jgi:hypothetical protein
VGFGPAPGRAHIVGVATPILTRATDVSDRQQTEALLSIARPRCSETPAEAGS